MHVRGPLHVVDRLQFNCLNDGTKNAQQSILLPSPAEAYCIMLGAQTAIALQFVFTHFQSELTFSYTSSTFTFPFFSEMRRASALFTLNLTVKSGSPEA